MILVFFLGVVQSEARSHQEAEPSSLDLRGQSRISLGFVSVPEQDLQKKPRGTLCSKCMHMRASSGFFHLLTEVIKNPVMLRLLHCLPSTAEEATQEATVRSYTNIWELMLG
ncbi:hypothetical protein C4D60_Mb06t14740 [Musa balbisiana]|uniref:Uncharacterized protein n=1 Tax=Musa balbisiana TaxID=52838 RepID=A0A4S8IN21_MUSBA|nr:hypothetical protein C4D60_Mb06t14740 [Musa balbisiana]